MSRNVCLCFFFILNVFLCLAQDAKLLQVKPIEDISSTPIYPRLTESINGETQWKEKFSYIDEIDMNWISYQSDGLTVSGLLVKPKTPGNYPCIIYNRGGNRNFGGLTVMHAAVTLGNLANQGYVVIASNYRGNGKGEGKEEFGGKDVNDVLNLIEVLKEVEGANTDKIGMYGWSRGGMMTYLALTRTNQIDAACVGGAPSDLRIIDRPEMESKVYAELIPNYYKNKEVELRNRSAVCWADKFSKEVPILILHGNADWRVKSSNSLKLALELDKHRVPYRLMIFEGGDHGLSEFKEEVNQEVINWFRRFLKEEEQVPLMDFHGK